MNNFEKGYKGHSQEIPKPRVLNHQHGERKSNSVKGVQDKSAWDVVSQNE